LKQDYRQTLKEINPKVHQVLEEQGYDLVKVDSLEFKQLREELIQLKLDQFEQKRVLLMGEPDPVETVDSEPIPSVINQDSVESIKLSKLCDRFITSREEMGTTPQTISDYMYSTELLLDTLTDIPISGLGHQHGRELVQVLKKLPKNRKKYPDQSINDLLKMKNVEVLSDSTIKKIFNKILILFNWSINQGYLSQNVFKGKLDLTQKKPVIEKYFTDSKLELICGDQLKKESFNKDRPERYWVSMISLYSGSRLNEICQMNLSDIEDQDGIWVMKITNDSEDKNVKTQSGNRIVPLHPQLIELGLLDYVEEIRNRNETKLFPNLKKSQVASYRSQVNQWFSRYLKNLGIKKR
jgi:integrase